MAAQMSTKINSRKIDSALANNAGPDEMQHHAASLFAKTFKKHF